MQVDLLQTIRKLMATHDLQLTLVTPPFRGIGKLRLRAAQRTGPRV